MASDQNRIAIEIDGKFVRISNSMKIRLVSSLDNASLFVSKSAANSWVSLIERQKKTDRKDFLFREVMMKPVFK